jgi:molecular chaperone HscB
VWRKFPRLSLVRTWPEAGHGIRRGSRSAAFTHGAGGFLLTMNLQSNDFELFGLPAQFAQDAERIDARWKELQREAHPDKFAAQGIAAQRVAMQWSVRINEAYQRLRDPLRRAGYLCELNAAPVNAENNTTMPPEFLVQQLEWREALEDASSIEALEAIAGQTASAEAIQIKNIEKALDADHDFQAAAQQVRSLMFLQRLGSEIDARIDQMSA